MKFRHYQSSDIGPSVGQNSGSRQENMQPFFLNLQWYKNFERYISLEQQTASYLVSENEVGEKLFLPLMIAEEKSTFGLKQKKASSLTNYYSPFFGLTKTSTELPLSIDDFVASHREHFTAYDSIKLLPLYEEYAVQFEKAFQGIGFSVYTFDHSTNWYHDEIKDFDTFWRERPSRLQNTTKRKINKLKQVGGFDFKIYTDKDIEQALIDFHHVYYKSWKINEPFPAFIDAMAKHAAKNDQLRLGVMYHDGVPVASQLWIVQGTTAYIYKLCYVEEFSELSIGTVLSRYMFERVIEEDKVTCIDYLTGDDAYKKDWMIKSRPLCGLVCLNPKTMSGRMEWISHKLAKAFLEFKS